VRVLPGSALRTYTIEVDTVDIAAGATVLLSVVVIGRNEGLRLTQCLKSVQAMEEPAPDADGLSGVEIVYVDSRSSDDSRERAAALGVDVLTISGQPTAAHARNTGWKQARGRYVLFLDGDTVLAPGFANACVAALRAEPQVAVVYGNRREIAPQASIYNRVLDLDWISPLGYVGSCGGDAMFRMAALQAANGYDDALPAGEEPDLCRRLRGMGHKVLHIDEPMTMHDMNMHRFGQYWKRNVRTGYAYAQLADRYRNTSDPLWLRNARANYVRGTVWPASLLAAVVVSGWLAGVRSSMAWMPVPAWLAVLVVLSLRSAAKLRWKKAPTRTLVEAGFASHLQQLPILLGQLEYLRDKKARRQRGIIEYKSVNE